MRRRIAEAAVVLVVGTMGSLTACGDDAAPAPPSSSAGKGGSGGKGNQGGSSAGDSPSPSAGAETDGGSSSSLGGESSVGGTPGLGGSDPSGDAGSPPGEGGAGAKSEGGAGGGDAGPPDLIETTGGPWPDSFTARCSSASEAIACPQLESPFFGQDGSYRINVPIYASTVNTLTDSVTSLMWQLKPAGASKTQAGAVAYCDTLSLAGHDDWRLPTRLEHVSLLDEGLPNGFAVPPVVPADSTGIQWTASTTGRTVGFFFVVEEQGGNLNIATAETQYTARCVRGPALAGSLTVGVDTVTDSMTKLEWQRTALEDEERDWEEALVYCEALSHATKSDWRLPSIKELVTIIDETALEAPVVSSASFGDSAAAKYWSSTPEQAFGSERFAFTMDTNFGLASGTKMTDLAAARCVRTAN